VSRGFVDLSHTIESGMTTYPELPGPVVCDFLSREASRERYGAGVEFQIGRIDMVGNTGTYVDAPFHRYADGADLDGLALASLADLDAIVVRADPGARAIDRSAFDGLDVRGRAVIVHTGFAEHWRTARYLRENPFLTGEACAHLADAGATLVGIDSVNIDDLGDRSRPAHSILLGAGIPICEHLTGLEQLPPRGARFFAVPPRIRAFGTFPVRAFAVVSRPGS
jgi:kynurenine formamidase